jgi:hypothetical protein
MKTKIMFLMVVLALSLLIPFSVTKSVAGDNDIEYGRMAKYLPSNGELYGWIKDLWKIGDKGEYGYRMPGTAADLHGTNYVLNKFCDYGLENTFLEPVDASFSFPDTWKLEVDGSDMPCYFLRYAGFTPPQGITAPMVYVGTGSESDFDEVPGGVAGKIVVVDIIAPPTPVSVFEPALIFQYDPNNTLEGDNAMENWPPINFNTYDMARDRGAFGYVAILTFTVNDNNQFLHWYADGSIPGVSVSPLDGAYLRSLISSGPVEAKLTLTGSNGTGEIYNVYGTIPGKNYGTEADMFIVVETHHDGWASNEASGTAVVLAIAKYFSQFPRETRNYSIVFCALGSHFGKKASWGSYDCYEYELLQQGKIKCAFPIEMIAKQFKIIDGKYVSTGLASPRAIMLNSFLPSAPVLINSAIAAMTKYQLDRASLLHYAHGETMKWMASGIPFVGHISENAPQFTSDDIPDTVLVETLRPTTAAFVDMIKAVDASF